MASFIESTDLFDMAEQYPFSDVHFWRDPETQLQAIIAIHSTKLGPAIGGCRMINYPSTHAAVKDACCLAAGMSYKTAINRLPFGGGKAVIIGDAIPALGPICSLNIYLPPEFLFTAHKSC